MQRRVDVGRVLVLALRVPCPRVVRPAVPEVGDPAALHALADRAVRAGPAEGGGGELRAVGQARAAGVERKGLGLREQRRAARAEAIDEIVAAAEVDGGDGPLGLDNNSSPGRLSLGMGRRTAPGETRRWTPTKGCRWSRKC